MNFNKHSNLEGAHAFLGASRYQWLNYDEETLQNRFRALYAPAIGTATHSLAKSLIEYGIRIGKTDKKILLVHLLKSGIPKHVIDVNSIFDTFTMYVNDSIGFKMIPEQVLYYSDNSFGTADAISFTDGLLRIHDLKTGPVPARMEQLEIYAALFCLEYGFRPGNIKMNLRIYQNGEAVCYEPKADDILPIMDKIIVFDKIINKIKE